MKLEKFESQPKCKKCQSEKIRMRFLAERMGHQEYGWSTPVDIPERIVCHCERCEYKWYMAPAINTEEVKSTGGNGG